MRRQCKWVSRPTIVRRCGFTICALLVVLVLVAQRVLVAVLVVTAAALLPLLPWQPIQVEHQAGPARTWCHIFSYCSGLRASGNFKGTCFSARSWPARQWEL